MFFRILLFAILGLLFTACTAAKMEVLPALKTDSKSHKITSMPNGLFGGDLIFEPYKVTNISQGWIKGKSSGWSFGNLKYEDGSKTQDYNYKFSGETNWNGECRASKGEKSIGFASYGFYVDLNCGFTPTGNTELKKWTFNFKGDTFDRATGVINLGSKKVVVKPTNILEGVSFKMGYNTGYYFYLGNKIIGAVDVVSQEGPVWLNNSLSKEEKDKLAIVSVAFLLNQVVLGN